MTMKHKLKRYLRNIVTKNDVWQKRKLFLRWAEKTNGLQIEELRRFQGCNTSGFDYLNEKLGWLVGRQTFHNELNATLKQ